MTRPSPSTRASLAPRPHKQLNPTPHPLLQFAPWNLIIPLVLPNHSTRRLPYTPHHPLSHPLSFHSTRPLALCSPSSMPVMPPSPSTCTLDFEPVPPIHSLLALPPSPCSPSRMPVLRPSPSTCISPVVLIPTPTIPSPLSLPFVAPQECGRCCHLHRHACSHQSLQGRQPGLPGCTVPEAGLEPRAAGRGLLRVSLHQLEVVERGVCGVRVCAHVCDIVCVWMRYSTDGSTPVHSDILPSLTSIWQRFDRCKGFDRRLTRV